MTVIKRRPSIRPIESRQPRTFFTSRFWDIPSGYSKFPFSVPTSIAGEGASIATPMTFCISTCVGRASRGRGQCPQRRPQRLRRQAWSWPRLSALTRPRAAPEHGQPKGLERPEAGRRLAAGSCVLRLSSHLFSSLHSQSSLLVSSLHSQTLRPSWRQAHLGPPLLPPPPPPQYRPPLWLWPRPPPWPWPRPPPWPWPRPPPWLRPRPPPSPWPRSPLSPWPRPPP